MKPPAAAPAGEQRPQQQDAVPALRARRPGQLSLRAAAQGRKPCKPLASRRSTSSAEELSGFDSDRCHPHASQVPPL